MNNQMVQMIINQIKQNIIKNPEIRQMYEAIKVNTQEKNDEEKRQYAINVAKEKGIDISNCKTPIEVIQMAFLQNGFRF